MKSKNKRCYHGHGYHYLQDYKWYEWWQKMNHDTLLGKQPVFYFHWWSAVREVKAAIHRYFYDKYLKRKYGKKT